VKERRGAIGRATGLAEGVAATVRRMQRDREDRVLVYGADGMSQLLQPESRGYERLIDLCAHMVELVGPEQEPGRRRAERQ
jgi:hypothetical protein